MKKKLSIFDFDSTMVDTPLPDKGRIEYEQKTGNAWPHQGWWGKEDSLDHTIFEMPSNPIVIEDYTKEAENPETELILLTGRISKLANKVKEILDIKGYKFSEYHFNRGGSTDVAKINTLNTLLVKKPDIEEVEMWDDRLSHIPIFQAWGEEQLNSGRLKKFKINLVVNPNNPSTH